MMLFSAAVVRLPRIPTATMVTEERQAPAVEPAIRSWNAPRRPARARAVVRLPSTQAVRRTRSYGLNPVPATRSGSTETISMEAFAVENVAAGDDVAAIRPPAKASALRMNVLRTRPL